MRSFGLFGGILSLISLPLVTATNKLPSSPTTTTTSTSPDSITPDHHRSFSLPRSRSGSSSDCGTTNGGYSLYGVIGRRDSGRSSIATQSTVDPSTVSNLDYANTSFSRRESVVSNLDSIIEETESLGREGGDEASSFAPTSPDGSPRRMQDVLVDYEDYSNSEGFFGAGTMMGTNGAGSGAGKMVGAGFVSYLGVGVDDWGAAEMERQREEQEQMEQKRLKKRSGSSSRGMGSMSKARAASEVYYHDEIEDNCSGSWGILGEIFGGMSFFCCTAKGEGEGKPVNSFLHPIDTRPVYYSDSSPANSPEMFEDNKSSNKSPQHFSQQEPSFFLPEDEDNSEDTDTTPPEKQESQHHPKEQKSNPQEPTNEDFSHHVSVDTITSSPSPPMSPNARRKRSAILTEIQRTPRPSGRRGSIYYKQSEEDAKNMAVLLGGA